VALLRDPKSAITFALIPGGITTEKDSPELLSLGTLFYQPLWVFSRGSLPQRQEPLGGLRVSVGPEGSSSRALSLKLLGCAGMIDRKSATLLSLTPSESAQQLIHGEIDVAIFLDAWESPAVQQLLRSRNVDLVSITRADAFAALYPYLNKLVLPAGVVDMAEPRPSKDVLLIASKSSLVVRNDLHPAIQYLLLQAADEIHSIPGMFHTADQFPAPESIDLPLSPYAREFYKTGMPFLLRHLPFWLAVLLEQPLLLLIPLLVVLYPLLRFAPAIYDWVERKRIYRLYSELERLEDEMVFAASGRSSESLIERLDRLKDRASRLSVPTPFRPLVYGLRLHIDMVRQEAQKSISPCLKL
jgi:NMT1-like family